MIFLCTAIIKNGPVLLQTKKNTQQLHVRVHDKCLKLFGNFLSFLRSAKLL